MKTKSCYFKHIYALNMNLKCSENTDHIYRNILLTHVSYHIYDKYGPCFLILFRSDLMIINDQNRSYLRHFDHLF